jgi:ribose transport system substrate-binding protein
MNVRSGFANGTVCIDLMSPSFAVASRPWKKAAFDRLLGQNDDLNGLFVAWDVPALDVLKAIRAHSRTLSVVTVDLGNAIAEELVAGELLKGVAAQRPYDQGAAAAIATLLSLVGGIPPAWIAAAGLAVTRENVVEAYQVVWHAPAPFELLKARI